MTVADVAATEEWRPVAGYDGWYDVSNRGRVRSWRQRRAQPPVRAIEPKLMKCSLTKSGYMRIGLTSADGTRRSYDAHRLVGQAFLGDLPSGMETCHGDGNRANNHIDNLRYDTSVGNMRDRISHGTHPGGERNARALVTEAQVVEIRRRRAEGEKIRPLADAYGIHESTVVAITNRRSWQHVA